MDQVVTLLGETSDEGHNLIVVANDAYFGLFYGAEVAPALVFARPAGIHPRLLVVKVNGPTRKNSSRVCSASRPARVFSLQSA
jgi:hypothetical protein